MTVLTGLTFGSVSDKKLLGACGQSVILSGKINQLRRSGRPPDEVQAEMTEVNGLIPQLFVLHRQMNARMDELEWPPA